MYTERRRKRLEKDEIDLFLEEMYGEDIRERRREKRRREQDVTVLENNSDEEDDLELIEKEIMKSENSIKSKENQVWNKLIGYFEKNGIRIETNCEQIHAIIMDESRMYQMRFIREDMDTEKIRVRLKDGELTQEIIREEEVGIRVEVYRTNFGLMNNDVIKKSKNLKEEKDKLLYEMLYKMGTEDTVEQLRGNTYDLGTVIMEPINFMNLKYPIIRVNWRDERGILVCVSTFNECELYSRPERVEYDPVYITYEKGNISDILEQLHEMKLIIAKKILEKRRDEQKKKEEEIRRMEELKRMPIPKSGNAGNKKRYSKGGKRGKK